VNTRVGSRLLPAAIACLFLAGVFTPLALQGQGVPAGPAQLSVLIGAAESSRLYAHSAVDFAVSHGLAVAGAQSHLDQGDSLLASAKADAQAGNDLAAGIQAAEAAMSAYTEASAEATIALSNAGLATSFDYYAAEDAIVEINATASVALAVTAQACASAGAAALNAAAFAQACSQVNTQVRSTRANLNQAASLLVHAHGQANATLNLSQAILLIESARGEVASCQSALVTIASYSYSARGRAFVSSVVVPLSAQANATIKAEQSVLANLTQLESTYAAYDQSQSTAVANVTSSASAVATVISQAETDAATVSTKVSSAQSTETQTQQDLSGISSLIAPFTSVNAVAALQTSIQTAESSGTAYSSKASAAGNDVSALDSTSIASLSTYLTTVQGDQTSVSAYTAAYTSACSSVQAQLTAVVNLGIISGLAQWQTNLTTDCSAVTSTTSNLGTAIQSVVSDITTLQSKASSLASVISSSTSAVLVDTSLVSTAGSISTKGKAYVNATSNAALAKVSTEVQATAQTAQSLITSANACLQASVSAYASGALVLSNSAASLRTQSHGYVTMLATAASYVSSDTRTRTSDAVVGRADVSQALQLFSALNVSAGAATMAQASVEFQAASSVSI
jgi:trimeric autotransporter adhesin